MKLLDLGQPIDGYAEALLQLFLRVSSYDDRTLANLYLLAAVAVVAGLLLAAFLLLRPSRGASARLAACGLMALLFIGPLLLLQLANDTGRILLLSPVEAWRLVRLAWQMHRVGLPIQQLFQPELQYRMVVSSLSYLMVLGPLTLLIPMHQAVLRGVVWCGLVLLAIAPTLQLVSTQTFLRATDAETLAGAALFEARCKQAGARKIRVVEGEAGIRLTSIRPGATDARFDDRLWAGAGIPQDLVGDAYIRSFLEYAISSSIGAEGWSFSESVGTVAVGGFSHVDVQLADGGYVRYRGEHRDGRLGLLAEPIDAEQAARYAVSFEQDEQGGDREHWVAGARVTVADTQRGEVIGELRVVSYAPPIRGRGSLAQRSWHYAVSCPDMKDIPNAVTRLFVEEIVRPARGR